MYADKTVVYVNMYAYKTVRYTVLYLQCALYNIHAYIAT